MYELKTIKGDSIICNGNQILMLKCLDYRNIHWDIKHAGLIKTIIVDVKYLLSNVQKTPEISLSKLKSWHMKQQKSF